MSKFLIGCLVVVAVIVFWIVNDWLHRNTPTPQHLMSPTELQECIGVEPDGKIGPETMKAWDKALCDQYAAESDEPYVEDGKLSLENHN